MMLFKMLVVLLIRLLEINSHLTNENAYTLVFHQEQLNHATANEICVSHGGFLPVLKNYIVSEILANIPSLRNVSVWIGLSHSNGTWQWDDGTSLSVSPWQLNNRTACVAAWLEPDTLLDQQDCNKKLPFFCQYQKGYCYFRVYPHSSIVGHNTFSLTRSDLDTCRELCSHVTEFECASYEYSTVNEFCQLNDVNRWKAEKSFVYFDQSWDYYHKTCYTMTLLPEDSDQTSITPTFSALYSSTESYTTGEPDISFLQPRRYVLQNINLTWTEAVEYCKNSGGQLAKIDDPSNIPETGYQGHVHSEELFWIGLKKTNNLWQWLDSSHLGWSNFKYKPTDYDVINVCGVVALSSGWWYTADCYKKRRFVCQYTADSCDFISTHNASIIAHNKEILTNISEYDCKQHCVGSYFCRSYEFNAYSKICQLSTDNRWTASQFYHTGSVNWTYVHRQCSFGFNSFTDSTTTLTVTENLTPLFDETTADKRTTLKLPLFDGTTAEEKTTAEPTAVAERMFKEIKQELEQIGREIKQKNLQRKRTSATDNRPSAQGVGIAAAIILIAIFGSIALLDISTIGVRWKQLAKQRKKGSSKNRPFYLRHKNNELSSGNNKIMTGVLSTVNNHEPTIYSEHIEISILKPTLDPVTNKVSIKSDNGDFTETLDKSLPVRDTECEQEQKNQDEILTLSYQSNFCKESLQTDAKNIMETERNIHTHKIQYSTSNTVTYEENKNTYL